MLKKLSVTYHAPKGDSKVVEMHGYTFHDGKAEEVELDEWAIKKLQGNHLFACGQVSDVQRHDKPDTKPDLDDKHDKSQDKPHDYRKDEHKGR